MGIEDYREELKVCVIAWIIVVVLLVVFICSSCNVQKKAEARVLSNEESFNKIGVKWAAVNPCINDSLVIDHSDTTIKYDTVYANTQKYKYSDEPYGGESGYLGFTKENKPEKVYITKTINIHDTVKVLIRDKRAEYILEDSLRNYKFLYSQQTAEKNIWKDKARDYLKWLIIIAVAIVGFVCVKLYGKNIIGSVKGFITGI